MSQKRIVALDAIRGFALFGIIVVNMMSFHSPILYLEPVTLWPNGLDRFTYIAIDVFFQGSFYPIFSLLFGYSLHIFYKRTLEKQLNFKAMALRRFLFLLAVGLVHAFLIWHGDILIAYALLGMLSLPFLQLAPKPLLLFAGFVYATGHSLFELFLLWSDLFHTSKAPIHENLLMAAASIQHYQQGTYWQIVHQRIADWLFENNLITSILLLITILPLILTGAALGKWRFLEKETEPSRRWKISMTATLMAGVIIKILPYLYTGSQALNYLQDIFGGPLLGGSYTFWLAIFLKRKKTAFFLTIFSYAGKLSMTNYLLQSIISTLIFYHYGLGIYGKISLFTGSVLAVCLFMIQIVFSVFWAKHFQYGPIEWLWRGFTYLHFPSWKKKAYYEEN